MKSKFTRTYNGLEEASQTLIDQSAERGLLGHWLIPSIQFKGLSQYCTAIYLCIDVISLSMIQIEIARRFIK